MVTMALPSSQLPAPALAQGLQGAARREGQCSHRRSRPHTSDLGPRGGTSGLCTCCPCKALSPPPRACELGKPNGKSKGREGKRREQLTGLAMAWDVGGQGHGRRRPWGRRAVGRERTRLEQATGARPAGPGTTRGRVRGRAAELQVAGRAGHPEPTGRLRHQRVDSQAGRRPSGRWGTFKAAVGAGGKGPSVRKTGDGGEGEGGDRAGAGDGHARSPEAGPPSGTEGGRSSGAECPTQTGRVRHGQAGP